MATVLEPKIDRGSVPESSDRSFGFVIAGALAIVTFLPVLQGHTPHWWVLSAAVVFVAAAVVYPKILHPLNRAWLAFGHLLQRVVSPVIMSAIFFFCVTPTAWVMRLRGNDLLSLRRRPDLKSYWIEREASTPDPHSMKNQY
jgi:hypothetical protein